MKNIKKFIGWILIIIPSYILMSLMLQSPNTFIDWWDLLKLVYKVVVVVGLIFMGAVGSILTKDEK